MNPNNQQFPPDEPVDPRFDTIPLHTKPYYPPNTPNVPVQPVQMNPVPPQPIRPQPAPRPQRKPMGCCSCITTIILPGMLVALLLVLGYFLAPIRTNMLVLGIDRTPDGTALGRSDTIILVSVVPLKPTVSMLSIPRDLWVNIPGVGENRINTAHFFAEANEAGSGPAAAVNTVEANFNLKVPYYVRVRFDAFQYVVDALGGVTVSLPQPMAGLPAGEHHLDGPQALAFVRDRKGTDDFFRMADTQFLVKAIARQMLMPDSWPRLPQVLRAGMQSVDTNLPAWEMPRIGLAVLRAILTDSLDSRTVQREMVTPFVTSGGAQVLLPVWDRINPLVDEMFR